MNLLSVLVFFILILLFNHPTGVSRNQERFECKKQSLDEIASDLNKLVPSPANFGGTGDKGNWHHDYLDYYQSILDKLNSNFKLLEIGIAGGYSVVSFLRKYNQAEIYGIDINLDLWNQNKNKFGITPDEQDRLKIQKEDATQESIIGKIPKDMDVILDDGSHNPDDIIKTFELLFPNNLKKGGIYIIEDIHCDQFPFPFLEYAKNLIPFTYKYHDFQSCKMLKGREEIKQRLAIDWKYSIKDITFSRDIIVITKENL